MAKQALLDVLKQTIGKYVKNLDAESLNVAVWRGQIKLQHLQLDVDAVNAELDRFQQASPQLALPIRVSSGSFESLTVSVPWAHLMSQAVVVQAEGWQIHAQITHANQSSSGGQVAEDFLKQRLAAILQANEFRIQSNAWQELAEDNDKNDSTFKSRSQKRTNSPFTKQTQ